MIALNKVAELQKRIAVYGDYSAYRELFTSFYNSLLHFAFTLVKAKQTAEEVVSDVFIKIWQNRSELEKIGNLKVYLYIATRNTALNYLQKQKRQSTEHLDHSLKQFPSIYFDPEQLMITAEMVSLIHHAIDQLPTRCRIIFKLVKEDNLKFREVAEILNIAEKTVENQLAIALQKIAQAISFDGRKAMRSAVMDY